MGGRSREGFWFEDRALGLGGGGGGGGEGAVINLG